MSDWLFDLGAGLAGQGDCCMSVLHGMGDAGPFATSQDVAISRSFLQQRSWLDIPSECSCVTEAPSKEPTGEPSEQPTNVASDNPTSSPTSKPPTATFTYAPTYWTTSGWGPLLPTFAPTFTPTSWWNFERVVSQGSTSSAHSNRGAHAGGGGRGATSGARAPAIVC